MTAVIKLSTIKAKANENFANLPVQIDEENEGDIVYLRNALQLSEDERKELTSVNDVDEDAEAKTQLEQLRDIIRVVAGREDGSQDTDGAERLIEAVGDNLAFLVELFKAYNEGTQAGEA